MGMPNILLVVHILRNRICVKHHKLMLHAYNLRMYCAYNVDSMDQLS